MNIETQTNTDSPQAFFEALKRDPRTQKKYKVNAVCRFMARMVDMMLAYGLAQFFFPPEHWQHESNWVLFLAYEYLLFNFIWMALDVLWLYYAHTTPGKWLFGFRLACDEDWTLQMLIKRTGWVLIDGLNFFHYFIVLFSLFGTYYEIARYDHTRWDDKFKTHVVRQTDKKTRLEMGFYFFLLLPPMFIYAYSHGILHPVAYNDLVVVILQMHFGLAAMLMLVLFAFSLFPESELGRLKK